MGEDRMAVLDTLRKALATGHIDFLREGVRVLARVVMEAEVTELTGAPRGERDRWTDRRAPDALALQVYGPDGCLAGSVPLPARRAAGPQSATWDGALGGSRVPDGSCVLQLVGKAASIPVTWPSASPATPDQRAAVGVAIDTRPPTLSRAAISATRLSPNGRRAFSECRHHREPLGRHRRLVGGRETRQPRGGGAHAGRRRPDRQGDVGRAGGLSVGRGGRFVLPDARGLRRGRQPGNADLDVVVDSGPPVLGLTATSATFSPNGDGTADSARLVWTSSEAGTGSLRILRGTTLIQKWTLSGTSGVVSWTGRDAAGRLVPDGRYTLMLDRMDATGNRATRGISLLVDWTAGFLRAAPTLFFPQDGDALTATSTVSFRLARNRERDAQDPRRVRRGRVGRDDGGHPRPREVDLAVGRPRRRWRDGAAWDLRRRAHRCQSVRHHGHAPDHRGRCVLQHALGHDARRGPAGHRPVPLGGAPCVPAHGDAPAGRPRPCGDEGREAGGRSFRATATIAAGAPGPATIVLAGRDTGRHSNSSALSVTVM